MGDYIHLTSCNEKMSLIFSLFRERGLSHKSDNVILVPKNEKLVSSFFKTALRGKTKAAAEAYLSHFPPHIHDAWR